MADFSATDLPQLRRRMPGHESTLTCTVLRLRERKQELADRVQEYDRALRRSQHLATDRKRYQAAS